MSGTEPMAVHGLAEIVGEGSVESLRLVRSSGERTGPLHSLTADRPLLEVAGAGIVGVLGRKTLLPHGGVVGTGAPGETGSIESGWPGRLPHRSPPAAAPQCRPVGSATRRDDGHGGLDD